MARLCEPVSLRLMRLCRILSCGAESRGGWRSNGSRCSTASANRDGAAATCEGLTVECSVCFSPDITGDSASHKYPVATRVRSMPEHSSVFHTFDTHIRLTNFLSVESQTGWRVFLCHFLELCTHFSYHKYICLDNILVMWWGLGALGLPFTDIFSLAGFRRLAHGCWSDSTACVLTN